MSYVLTGRLQGRVGPDDLEPLSEVTVRLYRVADEAQAQADGSEPPFAALSDEQIRDKEPLWTAQVWTNERGEFALDLSEQSLPAHRGSAREYAGEPLEIDVYCRSVPGQQETREEIQFTVARIQPDWKPTAAGHAAGFDIEISTAFWSQVRAAMDAWTIAGRVVHSGSRAPLSGLRVYAFDADPVQDDALGSAITDAEGRFRIHYAQRAFRKTPSGVKYERGGPDLYFRIEAEDGRLLVDEGRSRASQPDRVNISGCFSADLLVDA